MQKGKIALITLIPVVVFALMGCERSNSSASGAYWNSAAEHSQNNNQQQAASGNDASQGSSGQSGSQSSGSSSSSSSPTVGAADAINAGSIHYLHANVSGWPITSSLSVSIGSTVNLKYNKANVWPARNGVNANPWIIVNLDGRWTAATFEWLRPGQTSKPASVVEGGHIKRAPLNNFRPRSGETYGWMVSSLARDGTRTVNERTNIVLARWP